MEDERAGACPQTVEIARECRRAAQWWTDYVRTRASPEGAVPVAETVRLLLEIAERWDPMPTPTPRLPARRYLSERLLVATVPPQSHLATVWRTATVGQFTLAVPGMPDWLKPGHVVRVAVELEDANGEA